MPNKKIIDLENLKKFRQLYDKRLKDGTLVPAKSLTSEQLQNISDDVGSTQTEPFLFQATGTDNNTTETPTAPIAKHLELRGNSRVPNQLVGVNTLSVTLKTGHKYFTQVSGIQSIVDGEGQSISVDYSNSDMVIDLTLLGQEYSTVAEFIRDYPLPYYSPNSGKLASCKTKQLLTIEQNQWNEEWELGYWNTFSGIGINVTTEIRSKEFTRCISGKSYYVNTAMNGMSVVFYDGNQEYVGYAQLSSSTKTFDVPDNAVYFKFNFGANYGTTYNNDTLICLYWGEGEDYSYKPYKTHPYNLPTIELRSAGSVYDQLDSNGTLTTRIGVTQLKNLGFSKQTYNRFVATLTGGAYPSANNIVANLRCAEFEVVTAGTVSDNTIEMSMGVNNGQALVVFVSQDYYNNRTADDFIEDYGDTIIYYELEEYVVEEEIVNSFAENVIVDDMGTMQYIPSDDNVESDSNPIIPQGNKLFYPADYVLFIDDLYKRSKDGGETADAGNFVLQSDLTQALENVGGDATNLTDEYNETFTYNTNDLVIHDNVLYKALQDNITGPWDSTKWVATTIANEFATKDYFWQHATNSTTQLEFNYINDISISANTTFILATAPANTYPEYKANITNSGASDITITLTSVTNIKTNDSNITITPGASWSFTLPADETVEVNIQNGKAIVFNWGI